MNITDFKIERLLTVNSTNDYLKTLVKQGECEPIIVIADAQTKGRGTKNRSFISQKGGLYLSILLPPCETNLITPMTAVAVSDTVEQISGKTTQIKWVNDVYLRGKKLSGILCETVFSPKSNKPYLIVGIGLNLFKPNDDFSDEIKDIAISLFETEDIAIKERFINTLIKNFFKYFNCLSEKCFLEKYRAKNFILEKTVKVIIGNEKTDAIAVAIDDYCRLIVKFPDGSEKALNSGEVILKK
ncbi:MAG: biotin--[Clostridia bacterium]|nr:biotin--[acetyl-CoA-carboxylase] ligase [Clostridia bacterium]